MKLSPAKFNSFLNFIGQQFWWRKAYACPCVNPASGAGTPGCPQCNGKGQLWAAALAALAGVPSQKLQHSLAQFGWYEDGDTLLSIPESSAMYEMGPFDQVIMQNATEYFSRTLVHGGANEILYDAVKSITRVFWLDVDRNIVEGGIPTIMSDGTLTWSSGAPPAATQYSVTGTRFLKYFCFRDYPSNRGEFQGARLPRRVVVRSFNLFGR